MFLTWQHACLGLLLLTGPLTLVANAYVDPSAVGSLLQAGYVALMSAFLGLVLFPKKVATFFQAVMARLRKKPGGPPGDA